MTDSKGKLFYERGRVKYSVTKDGRIFGTSKELKIKVFRYSTASDELLVSMNRKTDWGSDMSSPVKVKEIVAMVHVPNPNNFEFVKCKDGNRLNVDVSNLEWVATKAEEYSIEEAAFAKARNTLSNRGYKTVVHRTDDNSLVAMNPQEHYLTSKKAGTLVKDADLDKSLPILPNGIGVHMSKSQVQMQGIERRKKALNIEKERIRKAKQDKLKSMIVSIDPHKPSQAVKPHKPSHAVKPALKPRVKTLDEISHPKSVVRRGFFGREVVTRVPKIDAFGRPL